MATKTKKVVKAAPPEPSGDIQSAGSVIYIPLSRVTRNAAIAAREGEPDAEKVMSFAENFVERRTSGQDHQISPALVRAVNDEAGNELYELIDGVHRFEACKVATQASGEDFMLLARAIPADDENSLINAIQSNEFRADANDFDRAAGIMKLMALGKSQAQCATIYGLSEASISQALRVGKLDKKYRIAIENGDLERDAAIFIANLEGDETSKAEVFEEAIRHKQRFVEMEAKIDAKRQKREADERIEEAKQKKEEAEEEVKAKSTERKALEKELKEVNASASKTKQVDELIAIRTKQSALETQVKELAAQELKHQAEVDKAAKAVEKAKADKEAVKEQAAIAKRAATQEDAKAAAQALGAKGKGGKPVVAPKTKQMLYNELEAMGKDEDNPVPESVKILIGKLQAFMDGEDSAQVLRNAFLLVCKSDEQMAAAKAAKGRKGKAA